jgi:actin-like ATPase involved in cell morphogenesis
MIATILASGGTVGRAADGPPVVATVNPDAAVEPAGQYINLYGANFSSPAQVEFGEGNYSASVTVYSAGRIRALVPQGSGTVSVIVTSGTPARKGMLENGFSYLPTPPPAIIDVDPVAALPWTYIAIRGRDFDNPTVQFGTKAAYVRSWTPTLVEARAPEGSGTVDLTVINEDAQQDVTKFTYLREPPPVPERVDPVAAPVGQRVKVHGLNFYSPKVWFGATQANVYTYTPSWVEVWVPTGTGTVDVKVRNGDGQEGTVEGAFTFLPALPPVPTGVDPVAAPVGQIVRVHGLNFYTPKVWFGATQAPSYTYTSKWIDVWVPTGTGTVDVKVRNGDGQEGTVEGAFTFLPALPPVPTGVDPVAAPVGQRVKVHGLNFYGPKVWFGATQANVYTYTPSWVEVWVPTGTGTVDVKVRNSDGQEGVVRDAFSFLPAPPPVPTAVEPAAALAGTRVKVHGLNFYSPKVWFGTTQANVYTYASGWIDVWVPVGTGTVDVTVRNADGQEGVLKNGFAYGTVPPPPQPVPAPLIASINPATAPAGMGIHLYGSDFVYTPSVEFGPSNACLFVSFRTPEHLYVIVPEGSGTVDITVTNPDGQSSTLIDAFTYAPEPPPPTVAEVVPNTGSAPQGVDIYGSDFIYTPNVEFGAGNVATNVVFRTTGHLYAVVPSGVGTVDVIVRNPDGQEGVLHNAFTYAPGAPPPTVAEVVPHTGSAPQGVDIYGSDFIYTPNVEFGAGNAATNVVFRTPTHLYAVVPEGSGTVDVIVTNPDDQKGVLADGFTYAPGPPPPTITEVDPVVGKPVAGVDIYGSGFVYTPTVEFGRGNEATSVIFRTTTHVYAVVPPGTGVVDVIIANPDGQEAVLPGGFSYSPGPPAPTVAHVVPATGTSPVGVDIYGSDFVYTPTVEFGEGNTAISVIFRTTSHLYAVVPPGVGTVDVIVSNPDTQQGALADAFTYAPGAGPPTVTSVVPAVGSSPQGVNIFGTEFIYTPTVEFGEGKEAVNVIFRTTTQIYAIVPEGTGTVDVIVTNPDDQQGVLADGFTYAPPPPAPTVTSVDPAQGGAVQGVTIRGSNFAYLPTVKFGENAAQYVNFVTAQELWVVVPIGSGTVSVTVTNPDQQEGVLENAFTYVIDP